MRPVTSSREKVNLGQTLRRNVISITGRMGGTFREGTHVLVFASHQLNSTKSRLADDYDKESGEVPLSLHLPVIWPWQEY